MSVEHIILGVISLYPCSGYDMKVEFEVGGAGLLSALSFGSIYPHLKRMEQEGLVQTVQQSGEGRRRKVYELTGSGWEELSRWLAQDSEYPLPMNDELLLKMMFWDAGRPEDRETLLEQLQMRAQQTKEMLDYITHWPTNGASLVSEYSMLVLDYIRVRLEGDLAWIDRATEQLKGPSQPPVQDPRDLTGQQRERRARALSGEYEAPEEEEEASQASFEDEGQS